MGTVKSIKVRNLRSFPNESEFFDIKKVNLLVGRNSSGKSSFLRVFPLLRQSFEETTTGPILWFGKYVDFGDFNYALNKNLASEEKVIYFDFKLDVEVRPEFDDVFPYDFDNDDMSLLNLFKEKMFTLDVELSLGVESINGTTRACYVSIKSSEYLIEMIPSRKSNTVSVKSVNLKTGRVFKSQRKLFYSDGEFIPEIYEMVAVEDKEKIVLRGNRLPSDAHEALVDYLNLYVFEYKNNRIDKSLRSIGFASKERYLKEMKKVFKSNEYSRYQGFNESESLSSDVYMYALIGNVNSIIQGVNKELRSFFTMIRYLGPVRATAERFYRYQDLRVNEIDHMGENLPMVIKSLTGYQRRRLEAWMLTNFGFCLELESTGSHMAIMVRENGEKDSYNISDMGFGYSQLLPIVVSIWMQINSVGQGNFAYVDSERKEKVIVIEQPELHLHPEMQYKFAQAIVKIVSLKSSSRIRFVFETHSKHMIDAFGHAIQDGDLPSDYINITLFDKGEDKCTHLTSSGFDEDGFLENWPVGFLSA